MLNWWLHLHLVLTCDLYPDVVHIHIVKTSVNTLLIWMLSDQRVLGSRGSWGRIVIGSQCNPVIMSAFAGQCHTKIHPLSRTVRREMENTRPWSASETRTLISICKMSCDFQTKSDHFSLTLHRGYPLKTYSCAGKTDTIGYPEREVSWCCQV